MDKSTCSGVNGKVLSDATINPRHYERTNARAEVKNWDV